MTWPPPLIHDLPHHAARRARRAGHHHGVALLEPPDLQQAEVGGQPGHSQYAQVGGGLGQRQVELEHAPAVGHGVLLHAERPVDVVADGEPGVLGDGDPADPAGPHDGADVDRRDVGGARVHPAPHGRVDGQVRDLGDELPGTRRRHGLVRELPVGEAGEPGRTGGQADLAVGLWHKDKLCRTDRRSASGHPATRPVAERGVRNPPAMTRARS